MTERKGCSCEPFGLDRASLCRHREKVTQICGCVCHREYELVPDPIDGYSDRPLRGGNPRKEQKKTPVFPGFEEGTARVPKERKARSRA